ncbi:MAG: type II toxin-antitoxin system VapC family toxin [Patescibacteria group bacterium]
MYILDTNTISYLIRGSQSIKSKLEQIDPEKIYLTSVTISELIYGAKIHPTLGLKLLNIYEEIINSYEILDFDTQAAIQFAEYKSILKFKGQLIDDADIQIGSIAKQHDMTVVTKNKKDFVRMSGLKIEDWS